MALDDVADRLERITRVLGQAGVPYAIVGGQAVALWVASREPAAVRTTKDVDLLVARCELPNVRAAGRAADMDYFEVLGVGMLLERQDPNPRCAVHLVWANELVRPDDAAPTPGMNEFVELPDGKRVVALPSLVRMKLTAHRDQDRVHLRDLIDVGLVDRTFTDALPPTLAARLDALLRESGR